MSQADPSRVDEWFAWGAQAWELRWLPETAQLWVWRTASYLLLHVLEDPAWMALIFC